MGMNQFYDQMITGNTIALIILVPVFIAAVVAFCERVNNDEDFTI